MDTSVWNDSGLVDEVRTAHLFMLIDSCHAVAHYLNLFSEFRRVFAIFTYLFKSERQDIWQKSY
jgi:hypothetical protein